MIVTDTILKPCLLYKNRYVSSSYSFHFASITFTLEHLSHSSCRDFTACFPPLVAFIGRIDYSLAHSTATFWSSRQIVAYHSSIWDLADYPGTSHLFTPEFAKLLLPANDFHQPSSQQSNSSLSSSITSNPGHIGSTKLVVLDNSANHLLKLHFGS